jgi:hypothetical protein
MAMKTMSITITVNTLNTDEFSKEYPQYGPFAKGDGNFLFQSIMTPESFIKAKAITDLGYPAVAGVAELCCMAVKEQSVIQWTPFVKQFIGAVVCSLMEANNYLKTGKKKSIPHPAFTKGEVYKCEL